VDIAYERRAGSELNGSLSARQLQRSAKAEIGDLAEFKPRADLYL
jgi:hypothetical protein